MTAKEILTKLISRIGFSKSILSSNVNKFYSSVPGEIISSLPQEERNALQNLVSIDVSKVSPEAPVEFFCDKYYKDKEEKDFVSKLKENFERKLFRRR